MQSILITDFIKGIQNSNTENEALTYKSAHYSEHI